ncbi:MAG: hypothetical protein KDD11_17135 [Acidobacteria bacterium]|nr:hypothetical protein [Acidobacteriota bacterium]
MKVNQLSKLGAVALVALTTAFGAGAAQAADLWLHVTVHESEENANVAVNLPLTLVETALSMIQVDEIQSGMLQLDDDTELSAQQLRELWQQLQATPDADFVKVDSDDETIRVFKEGNYLMVRGTAKSDKGSEISVRVPAAVVAALLDGADDNQLNIGAALRALAHEGQGELATITDDDAHVRVWIDDRPEGR